MSYIQDQPKSYHLTMSTEIIATISLVTLESMFYRQIYKQCKIQNATSSIHMLIFSLATNYLMKL